MGACVPVMIRRSVWAPPYTDDGAALKVLMMQCHIKTENKCIGDGGTLLLKGKGTPRSQAGA